MTLIRSLREAFRQLQQRWARLADSVFGNAGPGMDEMSRGEFISAFITERGLNIPAPVRGREQHRR